MYPQQSNVSFYHTWLHQFDQGIIAVYFSTYSENKLACIICKLACNSKLWGFVCLFSSASHSAHHSPETSVFPLVSRFSSSCYTYMNNSPSVSSQQGQTLINYDASPHGLLPHTAEKWRSNSNSENFKTNILSSPFAFRHQHSESDVKRKLCSS